MEQQIVNLFFGYIKPELLVILLSAYALGLLVKKSSVKDKYIIIIVGIYSISMSVMFMISLGIIPAVLNGIIQGILITALCVLSNQLPKQLTKKE